MLLVESVFSAFILGEKIINEGTVPWSKLISYQTGREMMSEFRAHAWLGPLLSHFSFGNPIPGNIFVQATELLLTWHLLDFGDELLELM